MKLLLIITLLLLLGNSTTRIKEPKIIWVGHFGCFKNRIKAMKHVYKIVDEQCYKYKFLSYREVFCTDGSYEPIVKYTCVEKPINNENINDKR